MRNFFMTVLMIGGLLSSCNSQNAVTVNGEKMQLEDGLYAHLSTNKGDILIKLAHEKAPLTTANFVALAEGNHPLASAEFQGKPFYDGLIFHRVIPNFMIQGGDPQGTGMGGPGYKFDNEVSDELSHNKGVISMANSGPNTNGSQFFITVAETPHLDGGYNVFGQVVAGQEVADSISMVPRNRSDRPDNDVVMETVKIIRQGSDLKDYNGGEAFTAAQEAKVQEAAEAKAAERKMLKDVIAGFDSTSTGMYYKELEKGSGPKPAEGEQVNMVYAGYFIDGTLFDTNIEEVARANDKFDARRKYEPFALPASRNAQVILGWREALTMMSYGDKWKLVIPPHLAYGERGAGNVIPPNSWLIFEVQMLPIEK